MNLHTLVKNMTVVKDVLTDEEFQYQKALDTKVKNGTLKILTDSKLPDNLIVCSPFMMEFIVSRLKE